MKAKINNIRVIDLPYEHINKLIIEIPIREGTDFVNSEEKINKGGYIIEIKKPRKSKNMNSYMWVLCDKLAEKMPPLTKEDIYQVGVENAGKWVDVTIDAIDVPAMMMSWKSNGIGWFTKKLHAGDELATVRCFIGSSVYDHNELRKLTNYIVEECKRLGIETATPSELDHLEYLWEVS